MYKLRFSRVKPVKKLLHQLYIYTDVEQHLAACILLLHPCTLGDDQLMATLMDHTGANCRKRPHRHKKYIYEDCYYRSYKNDLAIKNA